jgi:histidinol-phosphate aminotransferase
VSNGLPLNPTLSDLPVYQPGRPIEEVARELGMDPSAVIKLASNENPLGPSPAAIAAMEKALQTLHLYPDGNAFYLKQALAKKLEVEPRHLILGNGSNEVIEFVGHALMAAGTDVIVSQYCFAVYPIVTRLFSANLISVPAVNYGHDLPGMLAAITPQTRVMFVANPNNPTGTLARREDIVTLLNEIPPHVLLVIDEAYIEFLQDAVDLLPFVQREIKPNLLLMRTFSKIYGLAGLRLGYGIGHPDLIAALEKVRQPFNINSLVQAGAIAALDDSEHVVRTRANNFTGLRFLGERLRELGLELIPSAANFILVKVGDGQRVCARLQEQGVITRPMAGYHLPEFIRISVGTPQENQRCLAALEKALGAVPSG